MPKNIYVGNLPYTMQSETLEDLFGEYGSVVSARIITDRETGRSKGFGFVEMETEEQSEAAIEALNEQEVDGRKIRVNFARPKTYGGGGGGGRRSFGR